MPDDPRKSPSRPASDAPSRPFPREAYVFGWLVICVVVAEGIHNLVAGVLGSGILLLCLVPFMVWVMHIRPRHPGGKQRGG